MKTVLLTSVTFILMVFQPTLSRADIAPNTQLQKEIKEIVSKRGLKNMGIDTQEVTVRFLINAQNEVVIFETSGNSDAACEHVKKVLNYRQVKFKQAKQLVPYQINIRFVQKGEQ